MFCIVWVLHVKFNDFCFFGVCFLSGVTVTWRGSHHGEHLHVWELYRAEEPALTSACVWNPGHAARTEVTAVYRWVLDISKHLLNIFCQCFGFHQNVKATFKRKVLWNTVLWYPIMNISRLLLYFPLFSLSHSFTLTGYSFWDNKLKNLKSWRIRIPSWFENSGFVWCGFWIEQQRYEDG